MGHVAVAVPETALQSKKWILNSMKLQAIVKKNPSWLPVHQGQSEGTPATFVYWCCKLIYYAFSQKLFTISLMHLWYDFGSFCCSTFLLLFIVFCVKSILFFSVLESSSSWRQFNSVIFLKARCDIVACFYLIVWPGCAVSSCRENMDSNLFNLIITYKPTTPPLNPGLL